MLAGWWVLTRSASASLSCGMILSKYLDLRQTSSIQDTISLKCVIWMMLCLFNSMAQATPIPDNTKSLKEINSKNLNSIIPHSNHKSNIQSALHSNKKESILENLPNDLFYYTTHFLKVEDLKNLKMAYPDFKIGKTLNQSKIINAVHSRNLQEFQELLKYVDPSFHRNYLLRLAAAKGMVKFVKVLIDTGKINATDWYNWALVLAIRNKHTETKNLLKNTIGNGKSIDDSDSNYLVVLDVLIGQLSLESVHPMVKLILMDDFNLYLESIDRKKSSLDLSLMLDQAVIFENWDRMKTLLEFGADPFQTLEFCALLSAIEKNDIDLVKTLLYYGNGWNSVKQISKSLFPLKKYFAISRIYSQIEISEDDDNVIIIKHLLLSTILNHQLYFETIFFVILNLVSYSPFLSDFAQDLRAIGKAVYFALFELNLIRRPTLDPAENVIAEIAFCLIFTGVLCEHYNLI